MSIQAIVKLTVIFKMGHALCVCVCNPAHGEEPGLKLEVITVK